MIDKAEEIAQRYLTLCGFSDLIHHPDGKNKPPDFLINKTIAVEVTRLNSHHENCSDGQKPYAHQQYFAKVWQGLETLLKEFGPSVAGESWYVGFALIHPFKGWGLIKSDVKQFLSAFKASENRSNQTYRIQNSLELDIFRCGNNYDSFYVMGGGAEDLIGCLLVSEMYGNLKILLEKKEQKISRHRHNYPEWWLVLVDLIAYGTMDAGDLEQLNDLPKINSIWDRIVVISPQEPYKSFDVESGICKKFNLLL